ncbi:relaxin receptor 1-like [Uloborus diversus]|uniref:relaxin receptor 1-like n=1 Tax=Uloborus diversus TaxID=327109 RepID=UPI00240953B7|nr:relaxin receptor 1-like [Uloborus diversus]
MRITIMMRLKMKIIGDSDYMENNNYEKDENDNKDENDYDVVILVCQLGWEFGLRCFTFPTVPQLGLLSILLNTVRKSSSLNTTDSVYCCYLPASTSWGKKSLFPFTTSSLGVMQSNSLRNLNTDVLRDLPSLNVLDLTENKLTNLGIFPPLRKLFWLGLGKNSLLKIQRSTFRHLTSLEVLILKNNFIEDIEEASFSSLVKLIELNLESNMITSLPTEIFRDLHSLKSLYFKKFFYCSYAPYVRICTPKTDGLSSTEHLLVWPALRMSVWFVALMTCAGNTVVLTWRVLSRKEDRVLSLFIKNLAFADLLMGIYLVAVGAQDVSFRDKYNKYAHAWMSSWHCTACGVIAMISSEVSVLILSLITFERYRCIRTNVRVVTLAGARYCLGAVWAVGFLLAIIPVLTWPQEQGFYSSNGLCFPLHIDDPYLLGWEYSALVFFGINFSAVILIIVLYIRMFFIIKRDRQSARPVIMKKHEDAVLALRFFFIVLTDCLCWIPIVLIKLLALVGVSISHNLYACVVVFILPINSALNPVLYTIAAPTELRRRIEKWIERSLVCLQRFECVVRSGQKTPTSTPLTQSLTNTESRSVSSGSILPSTATTSTGGEIERCIIHQDRKNSVTVTAI